MIIISIYTGKEPCVYSEFTMFGDDNKTIEEQLANTVIHWKDNVLNIKTERELVPYYGNMCGIICATHEDGVLKKSLHISSVPYFLSQDWEWTERTYKRLQSLWKKCKREKIPFTVEYAEQHYWGKDDDNLAEMIEDINKHPYAKLKRGRYHSSWMQYHRDRLIETMRQFNYTEDQINEWVWNGKRTW